jgi:septal ring-binding cell division protein DamX
VISFLGKLIHRLKIILDESKHQATDPTAPITLDAAPNANTAAPDTTAATPDADTAALDADTVAPNADAAAPDTATTAPTAPAAAPNTTTAPAAAVAGLASDDDGMDMDHQPRDDEGGEHMPSADIFAGLNV